MGRPSQENKEPTFSKEPSIALEEMMNEYGTLVLRTAIFYLGDRHLAEDVSQEVFFRVYRNWKKFRGKSTVKTWIVKITINLCRDRLRLKSSDVKPVDPLSINLDYAYNLEEEVMKKIYHTKLFKYVLHLPAHYREVLYLYYYLDISTVEISQAAEIPEGTIRGRLVRARKMLGEWLEKEEIGK